MNPCIHTLFVDTLPCPWLFLGLCVVLVTAAGNRKEDDDDGVSFGYPFADRNSLHLFAIYVLPSLGSLCSLGDKIVS